MSITQELRKEFLTHTDDTGRFIIKSTKTNRTYYVEPIGDPHVEWGSVDPSSNKLAVKKGWKKNKGSVEENQSLISTENGFDKVHSLKPGISPLAYIKMLEEQYENESTD